MTLRCNPQITIISAYAPTELAQVEAKDSFYDELHTTISSIPAQNFLLVLGDFNARIGKTFHESFPQTIGRYFYHQETNDNGERLVSLCEISKLISTFHRQPHRNSHMWTWEHPDGVHKAEIDHILLREKWRNCRTYSTAELGSDHRIVTAELKISLRVPRPDQKIVRRDMQALNNSADLPERYRIEVSNRFTVLSNNFNEKSSQVKYNEIVNILKKANNSVLPKKFIKRDN